MTAPMNTTAIGLISHHDFLSNAHPERIFLHKAVTD